MSGFNVWRDFAMQAGKLSTATRVVVALDIDDTPKTVQLELQNTGVLPVAYTAREYNSDTPPLSPQPTGPFAPTYRHLGPKNQNLPDLAGIAYYLAPAPGPMSPEKSATSWPTGLTYAWGMGFNSRAEDLWIGNISAGGGDDLNYRFTTGGVNTGDTMDTSTWMVFSPPIWLMTRCAINSGR